MKAIFDWLLRKRDARRFDLQMFAACPYPRIADALAAGSVTVSVPWSIPAGVGMGPSASGTATYTITVSSGNIAAIAPQLFALLDSADALARGGNAIAVVT